MSIRRAQDLIAKGPRKCSDHSLENVQRACVTCNFKLVCFDCATSEQHQGHKFLKIDEAAEIKRERLGQLLSASNEKKTNLETAITASKDLQNTGLYDAILARIDAREIKLVSEIQKNSNSLKSKVLQEKEKYLQSIEDILSKQNSYLGDISGYIVKGEDDSNNLSSFEIFDLVDQLEFCLERSDAKSPDKPVVRFDETSFDEIDMNSLFGKLWIGDSEDRLEKDRTSISQASPTIQSVLTKDTETESSQTQTNTFQFEHCICTVWPVGTDKAWVVHSIDNTLQKEINLILMSGSVQDRIMLNEKVIDCAKTIAGDELVCCFDDKSIRTLSGLSLAVNFHVEDRPHALCVTVNGDIIVSLFCKVVKYNRSGKPLKTLKALDKFGKKSGISHPAELAVCDITQKVAVVDRDEPYTVAMLDQNFRIIWRFNGQAKTKSGEVLAQWHGSEFMPNDVAFDRNGNLLIADASYTIAVVDPNGYFLRVLVTDLIDVPSSINFDVSGKLWIGFWNGAITKIEYEA